MPTRIIGMKGDQEVKVTERTYRCAQQLALRCSGSGDKEAKAKLCCVETGEVAVAFGPPA